MVTRDTGVEVGDICAHKLIGRRHLSDVFGYCVSWNALVSMARRAQFVACRDLPCFSFFFYNFWDIVTLKELYIKTRVCCTQI